MGFLIGRVLERHFGKSWFKEQKSTIAAGIITGEGLIVAFSAGLAMIFHSLWVRPI